MVDPIAWHIFLCAVYLAGNGCGKKLIDYLLFMLLTVIIELIDQIRKRIF